MLILARYRDKKIKIDDIVTLNIMSINHKGSVSVGIQAPKKVPVHREEIFEKVKENSQETVSFKDVSKGLTPSDVGDGYLIFTRHKGQKFRICDDVVITILGIHKGQVRLGIEAPEDVSVHRQEIWEKIQSEKA